MVEAFVLCVKYVMPMVDNEPNATHWFIRNNGIKIETTGGRKLYQSYSKIGFKIKVVYNRIHHLYAAYSATYVRSRNKDKIQKNVKNKIE